MIVVVFILALLLVACIVIAMASWGIATSVTGLTASASNTALAFSNVQLANANSNAQTTISILAGFIVLLVVLLIAGSIWISLKAKSIIQTILTNQLSMPITTGTPPHLSTQAPLPAPNAHSERPVRVITQRGRRKAVHAAIKWFN